MKHPVQLAYLFYVYSPLTKGGQIEFVVDLEVFYREWGFRVKTSSSKVGDNLSR